MELLTQETFTSLTLLVTILKEGTQLQIILVCSIILLIKTKKAGPDQGIIVDVAIKTSHSKKDLLLLMFSSDVVKSKVF